MWHSKVPPISCWLQIWLWTQSWLSSGLSPVWPWRPPGPSAEGSGFDSFSPQVLQTWSERNKDSFVILQTSHCISLSMTPQPTRPESEWRHSAFLHHYVREQWRLRLHNQCIDTINRQIHIFNSLIFLPELRHLTLTDYNSEYTAIANVSAVCNLLRLVFTG